MAKSWVAIVANPYAQSSRSRNSVDALVHVLGRDGFHSEVAWTLQDRHDLIEEATKSQCCQCVVVAGGDGTVADVINEKPTPPLAVLPCGNENLLARRLGFTADVQRLSQSIRAKKTKSIDLGQAGERLFSLMVSTGFDAAVVHRIARSRMAHSPGSAKLPRRVGRLSYFMPIVKTLTTYRFGPVELQADGCTITGTHAFVFNMPEYGLNLPFASDASETDGLLDWLVFEHPGMWAMAKYAYSVKRRSHHQKTDIHFGKAKHIRISGPADVPVQADGDPLGMTPVDITIHPHGLCLIAMQ